MHYFNRANYKTNIFKLNKRHNIETLQSVCLEAIVRARYKNDDFNYIFPSIFISNFHNLYMTKCMYGTAGIYMLNNTISMRVCVYTYAVFQYWTNWRKSDFKAWCWEEEPYSRFNNVDVYFVDVVIWCYIRTLVLLTTVDNCMLWGRG